jgi:perosamine synthetase
MIAKNSLSQRFLETLKSALPEGRDFIPLHEPAFTQAEKDNVLECLDTGWVSYAGEFVKKFDQDLAAYTKSRHAICVSSGTAALHVALVIAGVKLQDEVLIPALTFVATANAVSYVHAIPHFVESETISLGIDVPKLDHYLSMISFQNDANECISKLSKRRISAIIPVHVFGHPGDMDALTALCKKYNLALIEDATESFGSYYKGRPCGNEGLMSTLSFNGNKIITTGGGGAILTNSDEIAEKVRHITTTAKKKHPYRFIHDEIAFNYRMPNINAAIGCAQLEKMDGYIRAKRKIAQRYEDVFSAFEGARFFKEPDYATSNYWLNAVMLDDDNAGWQDDILEVTNGAGVMTRPVWELMNTLPMFAHCPSMALDVSKNIAGRLINIPSSPNLAS